MIFQFSSFSTTHESYLDKLVTAWDVDSAHYPKESRNPYSNIKKASVSSDFLRIVWPTRKETIQTTGMVFVVVILVAIMLWALDTFLGWAVGKMLGWGG